MKIPQSQFEYILDLYDRLLLSCCVSQDSYFQSQSKLDSQTLRSRATSIEGIQFLTKTLPKLGNALIQGLLNKKFVCPREFGRKPKLSKSNKSIPVFLHAYFNLLFDEEGILRDDAPVWAVKHIRQVCFFVYKLELPYSKADEQRVLNAFVGTELELSALDLSANPDLDLASEIAYHVFRNFNPESIIPRHGPGAVASGELGEQKWQFTTLYDAIHQVYPYYTYFMVGRALELIDRKDWYLGMTRRKTGIAKVSLVPKDSRGPRLISSEPLEYMWLQQGLGRSIMTHLERFTSTAGQINFTDQSINRSLALMGSAMTELPPTPTTDGPLCGRPFVDLTPFPTQNLTSGLSAEKSRAAHFGLRLFPSVSPAENLRWVTLDLKDASDRVGVELVSRVFCKTPTLLRALLSLRTTATRLPNGTVQHLSKFAPMGSALCFPVESFVFWCLIVAAITRKLARRLSEVMKEVFVYGDDIIIPKKYASIAMQALHRGGLKVNRDKSCITGDFRESCGEDAFKGESVSMIKLKQTFDRRGRDGLRLVSWISTANLLSQQGYQDAAEYMFTLAEKTYRFKLPYGTSRAGYPCRILSSVFEAEFRNRLKFRTRWNSDFQYIEFRCLRLTNVTADTTLDGWTRLLRNLTVGVGDDPSLTVVPDSTRLEFGWTQTA